MSEKKHGGKTVVLWQIPIWSHCHRCNQASGFALFPPTLCWAPDIEWKGPEYLGYQPNVQISLPEKADRQYVCLGEADGRHTSIKIILFMISQCSRHIRRIILRLVGLGIRKTQLLGCEWTDEWTSLGAGWRYNKPMVLVAMVIGCPHGHVGSCGLGPGPGCPGCRGGRGCPGCPGRHVGSCGPGDR